MEKRTTMSAVELRDFFATRWAGFVLEQQKTKKVSRERLMDASRLIDMMFDEDIAAERQAKPT